MGRRGWVEMGMALEVWMMNRIIELLAELHDKDEPPPTYEEFRRLLDEFCEAFDKLRASDD